MALCANSNSTVVQNVIIQAGGLGSRLQGYTVNKPKCLIPVRGKTMLDHHLDAFGSARVVIIADYKYEVLKAYVATFYKTKNVVLVRAPPGTSGTCSGIAAALRYCNDDGPIGLVWSDLILPGALSHPREADIQIVTSTEVECRYQFEDPGTIIKETGTSNGIVGIFSFKNKHVLEQIPKTGSLVGGWLKNEVLSRATPPYSVINSVMEGIQEIGTLKALKKAQAPQTCRFFNEIKIEGDRVYKKCINENYQHLIDHEQRWYEVVSQKGFTHVPQVISKEPYTLQRILGYHPHQRDIKAKTQEAIFCKIAEALHRLHDMDSVPSTREDVVQIYATKTMHRVARISSLIPFYKDPFLIINHKKYSNPFAEGNRELFIKEINNIEVEEFNIIHGDPTFNNLLISNDNHVTFIDPRGLFGSSVIYGDKDYDWAKLYYSLVGNYDAVNEGNFSLTVHDNCIDYVIKSSGWAHLEEKFYALSKLDKKKNMLLNTVIWFSLCGYITENYDAILVAYAKGVEYWNRYLQ